MNRKAGSLYLSPYRSNANATATFAGSELSKGSFSVKFAGYGQADQRDRVRVGGVEAGEGAN